MSDIPETAAPEPTLPDAPRPKPPHIGAFVLETLTLGMYGEPRHTLREYVQNAFDSIQLAIRNNWMTGLGKVEVTIDPDQITIKDNGTGIPAEQAWATLTSIGASKKDRQRDAGFRGIGRLAGMAYCDTLVFRTRFSEEQTISVIRFNCAKLLKAMNPDGGGDVELAHLLATAISQSSEEVKGDTDPHFMEVQMIGLKNAPEKLTDAEEVKSYLSETSPISYKPDWAHAAKLEEGYQNYFGAPLQKIDLFVTAGGTTEQIFKAYGDSYEHAKGTTDLADVQIHSNSDGSYWGWVGVMEEVVAITDDKTRGVRARVRNIQVDGTEIFQQLFTAVKPSYGRLSNYYVGEIHIDPKRIVPNARRDGFEETKEWIDIKGALIEDTFEGLASEVYKRSNLQQKDFDKIIEDIEKISARVGRLANNPRASYDQVVDVLSSAKRLRKKAVSAIRSAPDVRAAIEDGTAAGNVHALQAAVQDVEGVERISLALLGRLLDGGAGDDRLEALRARIREELTREMLDVVKNFVDPPIFQRIRRELEQRQAG